MNVGCKTKLISYRNYFLIIIFKLSQTYLQLVFLKHFRETTNRYRYAYVLILLSDIFTELEYIHRSLRKGWNLHFWDLTRITKEFHQDQFWILRNEAEPFDKMWTQTFKTTSEIYQQQFALIFSYIFFHHHLLWGLCLYMWRGTISLERD